MVSTLAITRNELRLLVNQFVRTITTPSLLVFYIIMILGAFFASSVFIGVYSFAGLIGGLSGLLEEVVDRPLFFSALGLLSLSSVFSGYVSGGPSTSLETADEYLMMPAPVRPHQLFLGRYIRRLVRRLSISAVILLVFTPVIVTAGIRPEPLLLFVLSTVLFLEFNHFLSGAVSQLRTRVSTMTNSRLRHLTPFVIGAFIFLPTLTEVVPDPAIVLIIPSNAFCTVFLAFSGLFMSGVTEEVGTVFVILGYFVGMLTLANLCDQSYYESFSVANTSGTSRNRFSRIFRGNVDFSDSKFNDPMMWIMVKDFWSRMRTPLQFWKYVYFIVGTAFALWLSIAQPAYLRPLRIPKELSDSALPSFLLMLILLSQMSSMGAMMSFFDERDNIYLLKASPFRRTDIVLAKYLGSLFESVISLLPMLGLLLYFFRPQSSLAFATLVIPFLIVFNATGVMVGAYVPVFTNDPQNPPVAMVFSFPAINLTLGALIVIVVSVFSRTTLVLLMLPLVVVCLSVLFLGLSVKAFRAFK